MVASFIPRRVRGVAGGALVLLAVSAVSACGTNDGVEQTIGIFGSDTTMDVMNALANQYNADASYNPNGEDDNQNVLAIVNTPDPGHVVPGDAVTSCGNKTYRTPTSTPTEVTRPNGSTAGRNYLSVSVQAGNGCADIARSSGPPRAIGTNPGQDLASFEYYAFALDALGVTSASTLAPNNLTLAQFRGIYNCTFTNWNQVGGSSGPIQRYWPQPGSGTQQFALSDLTGFDPMTITTASCPTPILTQENTGKLIDTNGDRQEAIVPYSIANWSAMSQGTVTDERFGQEYFALDDTGDATLGFELPVRSIGGGEFEPRTPTAGDPNGPIAEGNVRLVDPTPAYPGVRLVFNVIDNTSGPNSYTPAKRFVGFDNVASPAVTSPLCSGDKASTLVDYGFGPLTETADPTHNIPGTACRLY